METYYLISEFDQHGARDGRCMTRSFIVDEKGIRCDEGIFTKPEPYVFIMANGSKWFSERPDALETLYHVLQTEPLDPCFEEFGNFVEFDRQRGVMRFYGNFAKRSHVFQIETNDNETIQNLLYLISENQSSPAYKELK